MNSISLTPNETIDSLMQSALKKVSYSVSQRMLLGIMAGMYIAFGSQGFIVMYGNPLLRAAVFPVGLMLIVLLGGELFTGNCLMTFALIHKKIDAKSYTFSLLQFVYNKAYKSKTKDIKDIKDINDNKVQSEVN